MIWIKTGKDKTVEDLETSLQDETVEINTFFSEIFCQRGI